MISISTSSLISALNLVLSILAVTAGGFAFRIIKLKLQEIAAGKATREEVAAALAKVQAELEETKAGIRELQEARAAYQSRISESAGINLNHKGQVLRLHRRGESIAAISSALRVPAGEVSLIVKVHEMTQDVLISEAARKAF